MELVRAYPSNVFWAMWGDLRFTTTWSAWALDSSGVWYPRQRSVTLNGAPFREYVVTRLDVAGGDVPSDSVAIPDSVRSAFATRLAAERVAAQRAAAPRLTPVELADGVVLYQGGYQAAAVRQRDGIVILEGPESNAKSAAVLADALARWPGGKLKAVVSTSPMWMHIGGLREYAARAIPIYALDVNVPVVRSLLAAPHRQAADSLARARTVPIIRAVTAPVTIGDGDNRLELRPARGQHASSMMLVWLPGRRLLYASDVVVPDAFEPVFTRAYQAELARIVRRERLDVDRVFGEHLTPTPWTAASR
jgi:glyoxylase-like metal-dependent hydrolase (beta-lactamase superfamily II)